MKAGPMKYLVDALRQRTFSPTPEGFEMDTRAERGGAQPLSEQERLRLERIRRKALLES